MEESDLSCIFGKLALLVYPCAKYQSRDKNCSFFFTSFFGFEDKRSLAKNASQYLLQNEYSSIRFVWAISGEFGKVFVSVSAKNARQGAIER